MIREIKFSDKNLRTRNGDGDIKCPFGLGICHTNCGAFEFDDIKQECLCKCGESVIVLGTTRW